MKQVVIRRCPTCPNVKSLTDAVTAALKNEKDVRLQILDGAKGEFSVEVDGQKVAPVGGEMLPTADEVVSAVRGGVGAGV